MGGAWCAYRRYEKFLRSFVGKPEEGADWTDLLQDTDC